MSQNKGYVLDVVGVRQVENMSKKCLCQSCEHYRKCGARNVSPNVCVEHCSGYSGRSQGLILRRIISTVEDARVNL